MPSGADPARQVAQLREALRLVERIAGREDSGHELRLDEAARISDAYDRALPIARRRFDRLAADTAAWTAIGVEALLAAAPSAPPRAAAERLAAAMERALDQLARLLGE
jgi:hypothetical protein